MDTKLAYDVGGYDGNDTAHYMSLGYRVVCIEADPVLAGKISDRFTQEIKEGRCTILPVAIGAKDGTAPFYLSSNPIWSSFDEAMATRDGCSVTKISVPTRNFSSILKEHGVPYFLKVDIEGADEECLRALDQDLPEYLSFEAARDSLGMIGHLALRGYTRFSLVRQDNFSTVSVPPPAGISHVVWSARQYLRHWLRRQKGLHTLARALKPNQEGSHEGSKAGLYKVDSAGPTPMEHATQGWYSVTEFVYLWTNVVYSGLIDSVWYDIHAAIR